MKQQCLKDTRVFYENNLKFSYAVIQHNLYALGEASRLDWFRNQTFTINGEYQPIFAEVPTYTQMAYSFNLIDYEELINIEA